MPTTVPPPPTAFSPETLSLHDAIDAATRSTGVAWLHPTTPTVMDDLLGSQGVVDWQEAKAAAFFTAEQGWSEQPPFYARYGTHATRTLIGRVKALEDARAAVVVDCGMQATALLLDVLMKPGAHAVVLRQIYNKTLNYAKWAAGRTGGSVTVVDDDDLEGIRAAIRPETTALVAETMTNPRMRVQDVGALGALADAARAEAPDLRLVLDTTITTPWGFRQSVLSVPGVDFVVASGTKALSGQDTVMWGYVASNRVRQVNQVMDLVAMRGGILDWRRARAVLEGLDDAEQRFRTRCATATRVAAWLDAHPGVALVLHPSLPGHPGQAALARWFAEPGSLLSFRLTDADEDETGHFCDVLAMTRVVRYATSFDGLVTKVNHHASVSEYFTPPPVRERAGIDRLVRLAPGVEAAEDVLACLEWALRWYREISADDVQAWRAARRADLGLAPTP